MNSRLKVFGLIAVLGFVAGIIAQVSAVFVVPWMIAVLPLLGGMTSFMISGLAGSCLTVAIVGAWVYMTGKKGPY
jgi:hypothetical protein